MPQALDAIVDGLRFDSSTRLFRVLGSGGIGKLLVEAWSLREALDQPWTLELSVLSLDASLDTSALLAEKVTLQCVLADGSLSPRTGIVFAASSEESDGGFARYRLTLRPWIALLAHSRRSQVWQEQTTTQIVESVFSRYSAHAQWRWADDVSGHLAQSPWAGSGERRSYTVQYRETDLAFVSRLLAEEGLGWRVEEDEKAPSGHGLVIFADSPAVSSCPEDVTSKAGGGIRFHRSASVETSDAIQAFGGMRTLQSAATAVLAWDYAAKRAVATTVPTHHTFGGINAPNLEDYRPSRAYAFASAAQAQRAATLGQEAIEVRNKSWLGRSTVRTLQPGSTFTLTDSPLDLLDVTGNGKASAGKNKQDNTRFLVTAVIHAGINNLPKSLSEAIATRVGNGSAELLADWVDDEVRAQAVATGYGNHFEATRAYVPWRPLPLPRPRAPGPLTAEVVGGDSGNSSGGGEIHTDKLGRIRIRHDFQPQGEGSTWVRVLQPMAGAGMGLHFTPRIGQQVLVDFFDDDLDRPFVRAALYQGRGEGGVAATPGGAAASADLSAFAKSSDHQPSSQGNLAGGNAPPWHGASPGEIGAGGQRNAAALSGWKTKEFGGAGFNQLVFDDSNGQLRTQLASTQFATQLNLGHLIHQADNHRGSFRGLGFELRTDAYGTLRGARGVVLSSYGIAPAEPSGDNVAGIALAGQLATLAQTFSGAAKTHQTVQLAASIGSMKAKQSTLSDKEAPAAAWRTALKGMVGSDSLDAALADAGRKSVAPGDGKVPHTTDPVVAISAKAGLAIAAGQDVAMVAGENVVVGAGQDLSMATGGSARIHSGQAIGVLGGAIGPGDQAAGKGLTLIAGQGDVELQAQADTMQVAAKGDVQIQSKSSHIDWAAAKKITLATAGGASLTLAGGNITVECPGKITVRAGTKSFVGPERLTQDMPSFPTGTLVVPMLFKFDNAPAGIKTSWAGMPFKLYADGAMIKQGVLNESGAVPVMHSPAVQHYKLEMANGVQYDLPLVDDFKNPEQGKPANSGFLKHEAGPPPADTGDTRVTDTLRTAYRKAFPT